jgi:hypothetical protein
MKNRKIIYKSILLCLLLFFTINSYSQSGLNFQGVARTTNNIILASQSIGIRLTILRENTDGTKFEEYVETRKIITNAQGLFTVVIGDTGTISKLGNFATINWRLSPKFLKIEMDPTGGNNFITMGTTQFQYVAYAQFAKSVDADNIIGIVPVTLGGTGVNNLTGLKTALALDKINNTTDQSKPISTLTQTALDLKLNAVDTIKYTKQTYTDSALLTKLSITGNATTATSATNATTAGTATSATKLATARNINGVSFDGSADITITSIADAGTLTGTTLKSTITGSSLTSVGTLANLTVTNPIAGSITGNAATASTATKLSTARSINGVQFDGTADITVNADAGTLTGTTLKSTVTGSSLTSVGTLANLTVTNPIAGSITGNAATATIADNVSATTNTTLTMLSNLSTIGTITSGVWSGSIISIEKGGTGLNATGTNGQILTSTSSGTLTWTNFPGKHYIGEEYGGGIVFYTYDEGRHGLIAALNDVVPSGGGNVMAWSEGGNRIITRDGINAGIYNTEVINSKTNFPESYAAGKCKDYNANNLGDWYLPSKYELQLLNLQRFIIPGFSGGFYWSSTAYYEDGSNDKAWGIDFSGGGADKLSRTNTNRARAIRSF